MNFQVEEDDFQRVSSITRSTLLFGRFASGILSQLLHSYGVLDIHQVGRPRHYQAGLLYYAISIIDCHYLSV